MSASFARFRRSYARYHWLSPVATLVNKTGDEPGVDVKSRRDEETYSHLTAPSKITVSWCQPSRTDRQVVDYCSDPEGRNTRADFDGTQLVEWLESEHGQRHKNEEGKLEGVRWSQSTSRTGRMLLTTQSARQWSELGGHQDFDHSLWVSLCHQPHR